MWLNPLNYLSDIYQNMRGKRMKLLLILLLTFLLCFLFSCESPNQTDTTSPTVAITLPVMDTTLTGTTIVKVNVQDNSGISHVELMIDNINTGVINRLSPYSLEWNTISYSDGEHLISILAVDKSGNKTESEKIRIFIDNSSLRPHQINITSVVYDHNEMTIKWERYENPDFESYELFYASNVNGLKQSLVNKYNPYDTTYIITDFDPVQENWFWIQAENQEGHKILSFPFMVMEQPPGTPEIYPIPYQNNTFTILWKKSKDSDFLNYSLYQVSLSDTAVKNLIFSTTEITDTTYIDADIIENNFYYYEIIVQDTWQLTSESKLGLAASYKSKISYLTDGGISIMEANGMDAKRISNKHSCAETNHQFTPDGDKIVFVGYDETSVLWDIYSVKNDGTGLQNLTNSSALDLNPSVSPDGNSIIYFHAGEIYKMSINGSAKQRITFNSFIENNLKYSPDGQKIAFIAEELLPEVSTSLYIMNSDGTDVEKLIHGSVNSSQLEFSPDGSKLIFITEYENAELYTININSREIVKLTNGFHFESSDPRAMFNSDGSKILFSYDNLIYLINDNGSNLQEITSGHDPYFMPDGSSFVFIDDNIYAFHFEGDAKIILKEKEETNLYYPVVQP